MSWIMILRIVILLGTWLISALDDGKLDEKDLEVLLQRITGGQL